MKLFETHISSVIVAGEHAYKLKKPVALGFVDFTTLADRRRYCEAELRLNRRLAPQLYLEVVMIAGTVDHPVLAGCGGHGGHHGHALDYAVHMRAFPQDALASRALELGAFGTTHVDSLAAQMARFHGRAPAAPRSSPFGTARQVRAQMMANFEATRPLLTAQPDLDLLDALQRWTDQQCTHLAPQIARRHQQHAVRECHGDLHLGNIVLLDGAPCVFDCIEFNDALRWIDVASEIAFLVMDLHNRDRSDLAHRFRNAYLEATGDYDALAVLAFYVAYRALVRAKVAAIRGQQLEPGAAREASVDECRRYMQLAGSQGLPAKPALIVTHGASGSGKTACTQPLLEQIGAVRIRTDVERKRMAGIAIDDHRAPASLYSGEATRRTYERVAVIARDALQAGISVIVDGTFLARWQRDMLGEVARTCDLPFAILAFDAPPAVLRARLEARSLAGGDASDADVAVLCRQLATREVLASDELARAVAAPTLDPVPDGRATGAWLEFRSRLADLTHDPEQPASDRIAR